MTLNGTNITCTTTPPSPSLPCAKINADGVVTQLAYDSAGDLASSSTPDGNGSQMATTTYTYNADGEQTAITAAGRKPAPAPTRGTTPPPPPTTPTARRPRSPRRAGPEPLSPRGPPTTATTPNGNQTTVKDARGYTTTTAYNADDQPTLVTDPDGNATLTCYDGDGSTTQTVPAGRGGRELASPRPPARRATRPGTGTGWPPMRLPTPTTLTATRPPPPRRLPPGSPGMRPRPAPTTATGISSRPPPRRPATPAAPRTRSPHNTYNAGGQLASADYRIRHLGGVHHQLLLRPQRQHDLRRHARREHFRRRSL